MKRLYGTKRLARLAALAERDGMSCRYCDIRLTVDAPPAGATTRRATIDEWVPLVRGGTTALGNQVLACQDCNGDKSDMTGDEYLGKLAGSVPRSYQVYRREMKLHQQAGVAWRPAASMDREPHGNRLTTSLASAWPIERCGHSSAAAFCLNCAGR